MSNTKGTKEHERREKARKGTEAIAEIVSEDVLCQLAQAAGRPGLDPLAHLPREQYGALQALGVRLQRLSDAACRRVWRANTVLLGRTPGQANVGAVILLATVVLVVVIVLLGPRLHEFGQVVGQVLPNTLYPTPVP